MSDCFIMEFDEGCSLWCICLLVHDNLHEAHLPIFFKMFEESGLSDADRHISNKYLWLVIFSYFLFFFIFLLFILLLFIILLFIFFVLLFIILLIFIDFWFFFHWVIFCFHMIFILLFIHWFVIILDFFVQVGILADSHIQYNSSSFVFGSIEILNGFIA